MFVWSDKDASGFRQNKKESAELWKLADEMIFANKLKDFSKLYQRLFTKTSVVNIFCLILDD